MLFVFFFLYFYILYVYNERFQMHVFPMYVDRILCYVQLEIKNWNELLNGFPSEYRWRHVSAFNSTSLRHPDVHSHINGIPARATTNSPADWWRCRDISSTKSSALDNRFCFCQASRGPSDSALSYHHLWCQGDYWTK